MGLFLTIRFILLPKEILAQNICIYSNILSLYRKVNPFYTQYCTEKPQAKGLFIYVEEVIKIANSFFKVRLSPSKKFFSYLLQ